MPTEIRILIADPDVLLSLYRWLDADTHAHLDPGTRIALVPAQAVTATVGGEAGLRGLAHSYAAWRMSRRNRDEPPATFEAGAATLTIADATPRAIDAIAALLDKQ